MKSHKLKASDTQQGTPITFRDTGTFRIQAIFYSSTDPSKFLSIFDKDGDPVSFPMPGSIDPKMVAIDPVTVNFPLTVIDEAGGNSFIIRGELT